MQASLLSLEFLSKQLEAGLSPIELNFYGMVYLSMSQDGKLVVEDIPLVVWGLCLGKVGGVISCLFGPVRGYRQTGPQCLPTPPVSASSIYAAVVCVGGLGSVC